MTKITMTYDKTKYLINLCASQVPAEHAQVLANPVEFVVACDGSVRQVTVSRQEPEWSLNFKKALVVLFQSTVDTYSMELEQNRVSLLFSVRNDNSCVEKISLYLILQFLSFGLYFLNRSSIHQRRDESPGELKKIRYKEDVKTLIKLTSYPNI